MVTEVVMDNIVKGGHNVYGYDIGVLILDSVFPRIKGDIGNSKTWDYPVLYKKVLGYTPHKTVIELTKEDVFPFMEAAKELEKEGIKAITTSCGFLALFQKEISDYINIPFFSSALLLVPMLSKMLSKKGKIGILTANKKTLTPEHLASVGIINEPIRIVGLEEKEEFTNFTVQNRMYVDVNKCKQELLEAAEELVSYNYVEIIVLECTNMPPYTKYIQSETGIPVFDIVTLTNMFYRSMNPQNFLD